MKPYVLCILDGVGMRKEKYGNAVSMANMPNFNNLAKIYPHCLLEASGNAVGLPEGQMGNSEVGHTNIGAGRVIKEPLEQINQDILNGEFEKKEELLNVINYVNKKKSSLHIFGLLSDGGIHSHINHLTAIIDVAKKEGIEKLYFHLFLDGRDTLPTRALKYLDMLNNKIKEIGIGSIATLSGRYYAMDRDNRWDRIELSYRAIVDGIGEEYSNYTDAVNSNYEKNIGDEFIVPCILNKEGIIKDNDGLILFNFRPDRSRELFSSLTNKKNKSFKRNMKKNLKLVTMYPVSKEVICTNIYKNEDVKNTFGEYISKLGLKQLRIAETEKYAHVTYFFDGGKELKLKHCDRILVPSPNVATYDLKPEMSAYVITEKLLNVIHKYDVIILNFANGDMVGHTGSITATIKALEVIDECLGKIYNRVKELDGTMFICADHGNSDYMIDSDGNVVTSHSMSRVPFIITKDNLQLNPGCLANIAPTILQIMNKEIPKEMDEKSLIVKN